MSHQQWLVQNTDIFGLHDGGVFGALQAKTDLVIADLNFLRRSVHDMLANQPSVIFIHIKEFL
jgi:hypothetical protein